MSNVVHKLIQPTPRSGILEDLILCAKEKNIKKSPLLFSTSINDANCPDCWRIWTSMWSIR